MAKSGTEIKPVFGKLGPDFRENASAVAEAIKSADPVAIEDSIARSGTYDLLRLLKPQILSQQLYPSFELSYKRLFLKLLASADLIHYQQ